MEINLIDPETYARSGPPHEQFAWLRDSQPARWRNGYARILRVLRGGCHAG